MISGESDYDFTLTRDSCRLYIGGRKWKFAKVRGNKLDKLRAQLSLVYREEE